MAEISSWACQSLANLNKMARLAWMGRKPRYDGEVDPGDFALVQLYPKRLVGPLDMPYILSELWDYTLGVDQYGQPETRRISRGRLYDRKGGLTRDYDTISWIPVLVAKFADFGVANSAVPHGGFLPLVRAWSEDIIARHKRSAEEKGRALSADASAIAEENTDFLWSMAQNTDAWSDRTTTKEERVEAHRAIVEKEQYDFVDYYDNSSAYKKG